MKHNSFTCVNIFWHNRTAPWHASHLGKVFTTVMAETGSCIILVVELVILQVLCHWTKNNSPTGKVTTIWSILLEFPDCSNLCLLYTVSGLLSSRVIPYDMFMSLPANSLMQSAWHVTAYVHIMTPAAQITDDSLQAYWHTSHFVALNEDGCVHCIKAHFE